MNELSHYLLAAHMSDRLDFWHSELLQIANERYDGGCISKWAKCHKKITAKKTSKFDCRMFSVLQWA